MDQIDGGWMISERSALAQHNPERDDVIGGGYLRKYTGEKRGCVRA